MTRFLILLLLLTLSAAPLPACAQAMSERAAFPDAICNDTSTVKSPAFYQQASEFLSDYLTTITGDAPDIARHTSLHQCLRTQLRAMIDAYRVRPANAAYFSQDQRDSFHRLQWMVTTLTQHISHSLNMQDYTLLMAPKSLALIQAAGLSLPLDHVLTPLKTEINIDLNALGTLIPYLKWDTNADHFIQDITQLAQNITAIADDDKRRLATDILIHLMGQNLFHLHDSGQSPDQLFADLRIVYKRGIYTADDLPYLDNTYARAKRQSHTGFRYKNMLLKEGDLILDGNADGIGHYLQALILIPSLYGHITIIARQPWQGWSVYYKAEIQGNIGKRTVQDELNQNIIVRPPQQYQPFFTHQAIGTLNPDKVFFDASFTHEDYQNERDIPLYCPEIVHYIMTRQGQDPAQTPFPRDRGLIYHQNNPVFLYNAAHMGTNLKRNLLITDSLLQNPEAQIIGFNFYNGHHYNIHPSRSLFALNEIIDIHKKTITLMTEHQFSHPSLWTNIKTYISMHLASNLTSTPFNNIHFSHMQARLMYFRLFKRIYDLTNLIQPETSPEAATRLSDTQRQEKEELYDQEFLLLKQSLFDA